MPTSNSSPLTCGTEDGGAALSGDVDGLTPGGRRWWTVDHHLVQLAVPAGGHQTTAVVDYVRVVRLDCPVRVDAVWGQVCDEVCAGLLDALQMVWSGHD